MKTSKRARARQAVETLERPEGVSAPMWRGVVALLRAIAEFYPNPYPSQKTLAAKTGYSLASIERYVACAKAHGLLLVKADAGMKGRRNNISRTNQYLIVTPSECGHPMPSDCGAKPYGLLRSPPGELRSSHSPSESSLSVKAHKHDPEGPVRQVGSQAKPPRFKTPPPRPDPKDLIVDGGRRMKSSVPSNAPRPPKVPPWRRTAARFLTEWNAMVTATTPGDHLRSVRAADTLGHFQRYLNAHFYGKDALTPKTEAEVADLIAEFMTEAYRGRVKFKEGQSAWMAFTGAWGRRPTHQTAAEANAAYVPPQYRET